MHIARPMDTKSADAFKVSRKMVHMRLRSAMLSTHLQVVCNIVFLIKLKALLWLLHSWLCCFGLCLHLCHEAFQRIIFLLSISRLHLYFQTTSVPCSGAMESL